jgi:hypothetical protein
MCEFLLLLLLYIAEFVLFSMMGDIHCVWVKSCLVSGFSSLYLIYIGAFIDMLLFLLLDILTFTSCCVYSILKLILVIFCIS